MAYLKDIPLATDAPSIFPAQAQQNFNLIESVIGADHITFNTAGAGFHNHSTYANQTTPGPVTANHQAAVYSEQVTYPNAAGTFSELFFKRDNIPTEIQMTTGPGNPISAAAGKSYLPGGMIIQWGPANSNGGGISNTFTSDFPTACFTVIPVGTNGALTTNVIKVTAISRTNFTLKSPNGEVCYYIAIGN